MLLKRLSPICAAIKWVSEDQCTVKFNPPRGMSKRQFRRKQLMVTKRQGGE